MKQGKRVKPKFPIEYRLLITQKVNEREKKIVTLFALRTVNEFTNFRYEIIVEPEVNNRTMHFKIRGLRAPQVTFPAAGPATFSAEYDDLNGSYDVIISKHAKDKNKFTVNINKEKIVVKEIPNKRFIEIVTDENEW
jgi:hypothetical protein